MALAARPTDSETMKPPTAQPTTGTERHRGTVMAALIAALPARPWVEALLHAASANVSKEVITSVFMLITWRTNGG